MIFQVRCQTYREEIQASGRGHIILEMYNNPNSNFKIFLILLTFSATHYESHFNRPYGLYHSEHDPETYMYGHSIIRPSIVRFGPDPGVYFQIYRVAIQMNMHE